MTARGGAASRGERPKVKACHVTDWTLTYDGFEPAQEGLREALTSTGNGYFCTRGGAEWEDADGTHYPGTYAHGIYNRRRPSWAAARSQRGPGQPPNWLVLKLRIEGDEPPAERRRALSYRHEYDFRNALVIRELRFRDRPAARPRLRSRAS